LRSLPCDGDRTNAWFYWPDYRLYSPFKPEGLDTFTIEVRAGGAGIEEEIERAVADLDFDTQIARICVLETEPRITLQIKRWSYHSLAQRRCI
jgi:hypothetical protein